MRHCPTSRSSCIYDICEDGCADLAKRRVAELEAALKDLVGYTQALANETSDPGVGALCAISNAERLLRSSTV